MAEETKTTISRLAITDLNAVDELMKHYSATIGFLPHAVLEDYLRKESVLGAKAQDGQLIGYLLYGTYPDRFRIAQLCVREDFRNQGVARELLDALKTSASTQKVIKLSCRNDFPAHHMWPKLGFVPIDERPGRSREGRPLTFWRLTLAPDDQLALFRANISDQVLDVVIDAQIFFDFDKSDSVVTQPSKTLISDIFFDSVNLWFTDELFSEINRSSNADERRVARDRTGQFFEVKYDPLTVEILSESLKQILPSGNPSQLSDINHLAKAAASDVDVFVTRDRGLLKKAVQIADLVNLQVLSPTALILRLNELSENQSYQPDRVSGIGLQWRRLASGELSTFPFNRFLDHGEALGRLKAMVESLLVDPNLHELEVLWSEEEPIALRGLTYCSPKVLTISLGRVATSQDGPLIGRFLISDAIYKAMRQDRNMVKFETSSLSVGHIQGLSEMGFTRYGDHSIRFCFPRHSDRRDVLSEIAELAPEAVHNYQRMSVLELERSCSPLSSYADQNHFLIPILPGYALNLVDRKRSSHDMFGGNPNILLLWHNVYYRKVTHQNMLKAPGRILWYVSGNPKAIVAVSHLDEVVIESPKELFRKFRKYGTLEWKDLYDMCDGDVSKSLMLLKFSHTFSFGRDVSLDEIREVFSEDGIGLSFPSPQKIPFDTFNKLFQLGYSEPS